MKRAIRGLFVLAALAAVSPAAADFMSAPGAPSPYARRYATDAFPGFDSEGEIYARTRKEPRWFSWLNGPARDDAAAQFAWAEACERDGAWAKAAKAYDALVRAWPSSPEAPRAQAAYARLLRDRLECYPESFDETLYLLDYYSSQCDYDAAARDLYETARLMRATGKMFFFFRFANTVDVRRAFEAVVRRAPGAPYAPQAMLAVVELRIDEQAYEQAARVCENLRSLYPQTPEAKTALRLEASLRMQMLSDHGYNRKRCEDTVRFLRQALATPLEADARTRFESYLSEAVALQEDEAYAAARFYDSPTRTRASAISAYERFLATHPASVHAEAARARLNELKEGAAK